MSDPVQSLFDAVREACPSSAWSRGVELVRARAVTEDKRSRNEVSLRVETRGGLICPNVVLYIGNEEWDCDCEGRDDVCEHVAAATIALRRAEKEGVPLPKPGEGPDAAGSIGYRFSRNGGNLHFSRVVIANDDENPLRTTLSAITSGRVDGQHLAASRADLAVESIVGSRAGQLPRGLMPKVLVALEGCSHVTLDGEPITTSGISVGLRVRVVDAEGGFMVSVARDASISETFGNGVALRGDILCPVGQAGLTGRELDELRRGKFFSTKHVAELVTELIPSLEVRLPVDIETKALPGTVDEQPRITIEVSQTDGALVVLPLLVYGDPPLARVDAGRLVTLGSVVPLRDQDMENRLLRRLQNELHLQVGHKLKLRGEEAIDFGEKLKGWDGEVRGADHESFYRTAPLEASFLLDGNDFDVTFEVPAEDGHSRKKDEGRADPKSVLRAWRDGHSLVSITGGGFAPLPTDWLERFGDQLADLLAARQETGKLPKALLPGLARLAKDLDQPEPPGFEELRTALGEGDEIPRAPLPEDLTATLRHYQETGVDWLTVLRDAGLGALLADDMGLGKTIQALCVLRGRSLVVAPTSVVFNWEQEIARFRPSLSTCVYHGPNRELDAKADITLTTYALLRIDIEKLSEIDWDVVVLDEAQAIKNPRSQVAQAAFRLKGNFRLTLTGTPIENRLDELWSQLHFLNRGLLGGRRDFDERYTQPIERQQDGAAERLQQRIRPFVLRRLKKHVAPELPPRTDVVLHPELSESERAVYDAIYAATRRDIVEKLGMGASVVAVLEALLRLRQAACHTALVPGQSAESSSKVDLLLELLDETVGDGHKSLVFSQWTSLLDLIEPHLEKAGIPFTRLDGTTRDRGAVVAGFQDENGPPVMLASLKAGGVGLNLTAADNVVLLDPWWNPAVEDQAADRAHRIGQDKPVTVVRMVTQNTVEERILALQAKKRELFEAALGSPGAASRVTRNDLLALLD